MASRRFFIIEGAGSILADRGMSRKTALEFKDHMNELSQQGKIPLYLASDLITGQSEELEESGFVDQTINWSNMIETGRYQAV